MSTGSFRKAPRRFAEDAALLVCAIALSYLEYLVPLTMLIPIPGAKAGLAHIAVNLAAVRYGMKDAAAVSLSRVLVAALLFGSVPSLVYSMTGALCALIVLALFRHLGSLRMSWIGMSVLTAAAHNFGQLAAAVITMHEVSLLSYLPVLLLAAAVFGTVTGFLTNVISTRLERVP